MTGTITTEPRDQRPPLTVLYLTTRGDSDAVTRSFDVRLDPMWRTEFFKQFLSRQMEKLERALDLCVSIDVREEAGGHLVVTMCLRRAVMLPPYHARMLREIQRVFRGRQLDVRPVHPSQPATAA